MYVSYIVLNTHLLSKQMTIYNFTLILTFRYVAEYVNANELKSDQRPISKLNHKVSLNSRMISPTI